MDGIKVRCIRSHCTVSLSSVLFRFSLLHFQLLSAFLALSDWILTGFALFRTVSHGSAWDFVLDLEMVVGWYGCWSDCELWTAECTRCFV